MGLESNVDRIIKFLKVIGPQQRRNAIRMAFLTWDHDALLLHVYAHCVVPVSRKVARQHIFRNHISSALHAGKFCMLLCRLLIVFYINLFEISYQEHHQSVKQFGWIMSGLICVQTVCKGY